MEESIEIRYTFVLLLAICDPTGHVIGTDVAIARRLNMPVADFQRCVEELKKPDLNSNSKEEDGKRIIESEGERGYLLVNYLTYREMKDEEQRREYMRGYMRKYRNGNGVASVNSRKLQLTQAEAEVEAEVHAEVPPNPQGGNGKERTEHLRKRICGWFRRREATSWSESELKSLRRVSAYHTEEDEVAMLERYYLADINEAKDIRRRNIATLLNNWPGEIDRARRWKPRPTESLI